MNVSKLSLVCVLACAVASTPFASATDHARSSASKREAVGVGAGVAIGAAVGGPVGAILGAAIGGHYGNTQHQARVQEKVAKSALMELESSRDQLQESISAQGRLDAELIEAQQELNTLTHKIEQLFVERALVDGLQFDVHFDTDDAALSESDRNRLARLSALLKAVPEAEVALHGFADARGKAEHNETLSLDRAYSVADTLNALGVAQNQIRTYALGESKATISGNDADAYARDRKVSIRLELPVSEMRVPPAENAQMSQESSLKSDGR